MVTRDCEGVECRQLCRLATLGHGQVLTEATGERKLPLDKRKHAAEEEQVTLSRGFDISSQWRGRLRQLNAEFAHTRRGTALSKFVATGQHGSLHLHIGFGR